MSDASPRLLRIRAALEAAFPDAALELVDESHLHRGHVGAREGKGHFRLAITSPAFDGLAPLARHRAVFAALGPLMESDIHALAIDARTPRERGR
jgi:BolA protein